MKEFISVLGGLSEKNFAPYGIFQISWIVLTAICAIFAFKLCYKKHVRRYHLSCGIAMLITTFYRIFILSFKSGNFVFDLKNLPVTVFDILAFTILLSGIFTKGKLHVILSSFNASFGFFIGVFVLLFPSVTESQFIGIAVQKKLNALLTTLIGVINLKCYSKTFKVFDFLMSASIFIGIFAIVETGEILFSLFSINFPCFFSHYFSPSLMVFSHLSNAFPHPVASFILALLFAELSAGVYYTAYRLSTKKKRY